MTYHVLHGTYIVESNQGLLHDPLTVRLIAARNVNWQLLYSDTVTGHEKREKWTLARAPPVFV